MTDFRRIRTVLSSTSLICVIKTTTVSDLFMRGFAVRRKAVAFCLCVCFSVCWCWASACICACEYGSRYIMLQLIGERNFSHISMVVSVIVCYLHNRHLHAHAIMPSMTHQRLSFVVSMCHRLITLISHTTICALRMPKRVC
ncbi:hypothetical protein BCR37DRAFT_100919 [Protomyces lactucae-debilis]|uniref:Uncharacterized protein n=1 Tax=Protomyces lactucae-debilis TaxID=2754530 RepID=A0A1Y2F6P1_PROLT|nr:uncharacterized protein BCR37DRAFT_100919 [Protomyces lactucae-debilis]ORY78996.1 hypothetical protein BCR37DRAFT_100919 [Protomyces lactucae-debilis]